MEEYSKVCPVCGKVFKTTSTRAKYCSDRCRVTGYKHKTKAAVALEDAADDQKESLKRKQADRRRELKAKKQREAAAADGDAFSRMMLAKPFSEEYWSAFQQMELEFASASGKESRCKVNGISVTDSEFSLKVVMTIQELGSILTTME